MASTIAPPDNPVNSNAVTLARRASLPGRMFGVVTEPQTYRNLGYLLLGLPMGTLWFTLLVTGVSLGISTVVLALLGIPVLIGCWYMARSIANVERATANALLGQRLTPVSAGVPSGNPWVRLRMMTADRARWRELGYVLLRFPVGIATFTSAVALLSASATMAYAPFYARYHDNASFGDWSMSSRLDNISSSPWSWLLVPLGAFSMIASFHLMNALAKACGRWTSVWLGPVSENATSVSAVQADRAHDMVGPSALLRVHVLTFAAVTLVLALIDLAEGGTLWIHWPLITWGAALGLHAAIVRSRSQHPRSPRQQILRIHESAFAVTITMLLLIDLVGGGGIWFHWPLAIWGALVLMHHAAVLRFGSIAEN